ncbi:MAG: spore germination protein [Ruminococcaceae bacterium]|nr:spore germination protein [Oscillospiraceae bacterium]
MKLKSLFLYTETPEKPAKKSVISSQPAKENNAEPNSYISNNISDKNSIPYLSGKVSQKLSENLNFLKDAFETEKNFDLVIREFNVNLNQKPISAFLVFYDGLSNKEYINRDIMKPLMQGAVENKKNTNLEDLVYRSLLTQAPNTKQSNIQTIIEAVGFGNCAVFVDGCTCAFVADIKGWSSRSVGRPVSEAVLTGPQEAFCESVMPNIALVRKILKDPNLIAENIPVGTRSKTPCALMYINGITNFDLVAEARRRLEAIDADYIFSSTDIEMFIEDSTLFPLPRLLKTERPDRAAAQLSDGKVVIMVQGSPFVLILPATAADLAETAEDNYVRTTEANFMRFVRIVGCMLALLLPGFFVSIVLYHHESIPTDLILAIEASREQMPFPIVLELVVMILAFELIKEASIRVPDPIGSTLGIVGGLILGQSAVSANIASPLLIIIVSISALGAFSAPSVSISRALSVLQFVFIFLGAIAGFLGIALGLFSGLAYLSSAYSFGVPFLSADSTENSMAIIPPIWRREKRPSSLRTQTIEKQPHISRKWKDGDKNE